MNSKNYDELMRSSFDKTLDTPEKVFGKMDEIATTNKEAVELSYREAKDQRNPFRTPTADELLQMRQYAIDYKKAKKRASKREIRNAVKEKFKIVIIPR